MPDAPTIHEQFECARNHAVTLTDEYCAMCADDPLRGNRWQDVAGETERARSLLERWLEEPEDVAETPEAKEHALVSARRRHARR
jgi:hypothetical protein